MASTQFQSTRPHGARPRRRQPLHLRWSFNPRAHTGRDAPVGIVASVYLVSIHAPTRGATVSLRQSPRTDAVSIHAPTRGATSAFAGCVAVAKFQSTRPHGARPALDEIDDRIMEFQSTRPHGARLLQTKVLSSMLRFNPRAHTGRDMQEPSYVHSIERFNPRAHTGRDRRTLRPR